MKGTTKGPAPQALVDWWNENGADPPPVWATFQNPEKAEVLLALLREQGFVCVYCGGAISTVSGSAHIEHFWPSSKFACLRFNWQNLYASCGPARTKQQPRTCGDAKGNWTPASFVHPRDPDCEKKFAYNGLGGIAPTAIGGPEASAMISRLQLDHKSLTYERGQIIAYLEAQIAAGAIATATVPADIVSWRTRDANGHLKGFGHVAARYLEDEPI